MIEKINTIKNLGIFREYEEEKNLEGFKKRNLIYGWNASGKTTLSKFFSALNTGTHSDFQKLKYKIKTSEQQNSITEQAPYNTKTLAGLSIILKSIKVFSKEYISELKLPRQRRLGIPGGVALGMI